MEFIKNNDTKSVEKFIKYFQETCKHLKYCKHPVISAPSGLALGGGEEILLQSNYVVTHTNIVMGLVETIVGLVPAGGGCKELVMAMDTIRRVKNDHDYAPLKVFDIIGYAKTATSPQEAKPFTISRQKIIKLLLIEMSYYSGKKIIEKNVELSNPSKECKFKLSGNKCETKNAQNTT